MNIETQSELQGERAQAAQATRLQVALRGILAPRRKARLNALLVALGLGLLASGSLPFEMPAGGLAAYLPLHTAMEIFTIVVASLVFAVGWNSYSSEQARNIVLLSCAFLAVALLDLAHALSFPGMPAFVTPNSAEKAIDFWLAARLCAALGLLGAALLPWQPFESRRTRNRLLSVALGATALACWVILNYAHVLPRTFVPGTGLTPFKIGAEYALGLAFIAAGILYYARARAPQHALLYYLFAASVVSAYSEICFTFYRDVADVHNLVGHVYKVIAYVLIYRAVFVFGVRAPYRRLDLVRKQLMQSNQRLQDLAELSSDWFWEQDAQLRFTFISGGAARKAGLKPDDQIGKMRWELPHEDIGDEEWRHHRTLLEARLPFHDFIIKRRGPDGSLDYLSISGMPVFDAAGAFQGYRGVGKNFTEHKQVEEALRANEERLRLIMDNVPAMITQLDGALRFCFVNRAYAEFFGRDLAEVIGRHQRELTGEASYAEIAHHFARVMRGETASYRRLHTFADGRQRNLEVTVLPQFDADGTVCGCYTFGVDITERVRAEAALRASKEQLRQLNAELERRVLERTQQLEAANRELTAFSYSVSHDLRAPLRSIDGFSRLLETEHADKLNAGGRDYLQRIRRASQRLGELIEDLLQLTQLTRGGVRRERVDLSRMAAHILADLRAAAPEREVETIIEEGVFAEGDARLLQVALENLLGNAWKFTSRNAHASIRFGTVAGDGVTEIYVRDNGAGFDPKYAGRLFGAFQRLHTEQEFAGSGIGLATVQRVVHAHGGAIRAEAQPGAGASFYFTVSAAGGDAEKPDPGLVTI